MVTDDGAQLGILNISDALNKAKEVGLDLIEIVPNASPPVCKITDFDKFRYDERKHVQQRHKNQKKSQLKVLQFRPTTDVGDYQVKLKNLKRFIESGDKVKVVIRFRGRELAHPSLGEELMNRLKVDTESMANIEFMPKLDGRQMIMVLAPKRVQS